MDSQITSYVNTLNFYIIPVANPDGFEYSRSDVTPQVGNITIIISTVLIGNKTLIIKVIKFYLDTFLEEKSGNASM